MTEVAQAPHLGDCRSAGRLDDLDATGGPLDDDAQIASTTDEKRTAIPVGGRGSADNSEEQDDSRQKRTAGVTAPPPI